MRVREMFDTNKDIDDLVNVHRISFWQFLEDLVQKDGGLKRLEDSLFDPNLVYHDSIYCAVVFCAGRAADDRYAAILERVLREHPVANRRINAAVALGMSGRYAALEEAYDMEHDIDEGEYVTEEVARLLVRRDVLDMFHGVDRAADAVDSIFDAVWEGCGGMQGMGENLNNAAEIVGLEGVRKAVHVIITHDRTPEEYSTAACRIIVHI